MNASNDRAMGLTVAVTGMLLAVAMLGACGEEASPEEQVRATIARAEEGAEARDLSAVMELVADGYADTRGQDKQSVHALMHGFFVVNQSVHLLMRVEDVEFPSDGIAEARVTVGMLGRQSQEDWSFAADVYELDVRFVREDSDWLLQSAEWQRPGR